MSRVNEAVSVTAGFNAFLEMELKGVIGDEYIVELNVDARHLHDAGQVHGGVILALLDTAMSRAARAQTENPDEGVQNVYWPTLELQTHFFRPVSTGVIAARGRVVNLSRRACYAEAELRDSAGRLLAKASATMLGTARAKSE